MKRDRSARSARGRTRASHDDSTTTWHSGRPPNRRLSTWFRPRARLGLSVRVRGSVRVRRDAQSIEAPRARTRLAFDVGVRYTPSRTRSSVQCVATPTPRFDSSSIARARARGGVRARRDRMNRRARLFIPPGDASDRSSDRSSDRRASLSSPSF
jgi:hypothetical protein